MKKFEDKTAIIKIIDWRNNPYQKEKQITDADTLWLCAHAYFDSFALIYINAHAVLDRLVAIKR